MATDNQARKAADQTSEMMTKAADATDRMAHDARQQTAHGVTEGQRMFDALGGDAGETMERMSKGMAEAGDMMRGNLEAVMASARACAQGCEELAGVMAEQSKKSVEDTQVAMRLMASAKSPNELMELSQDYWRNRFDQSVQSWSRLTETWLKVAGATVQPLSSRMALATDQVRKAVQPAS